MRGGGTGWKLVLQSFEIERYKVCWSSGKDDMTRHEGCIQWFLAQVKPNCIAIADRNLKRQGFETFLPMMQATGRLRGRFATRLRPLFPGYIFIGFDPAAGGWRAINSTCGITRLVSFAHEPAVVPVEIVSQLKRRCDPDGRLMPPEALKRGDQVCLTSGPFADFVANVEHYSPDQCVWVLINIMGGDKRVQVAPSQLSLVSGATA